LPGKLSLDFSKIVAIFSYGVERRQKEKVGVNKNGE
jgi:hypothetical protein